MTILLVIFGAIAWEKVNSPHSAQSLFAAETPATQQQASQPSSSKSAPSTPATTTPASRSTTKLPDPRTAPGWPPVSDLDGFQVPIVKTPAKLGSSKTTGTPGGPFSAPVTSQSARAHAAAPQIPMESASPKPRPTVKPNPNLPSPKDFFATDHQPAPAPAEARNAPAQVSELRTDISAPAQAPDKSAIEPANPFPPISLTSPDDPLVDLPHEPERSPLKLPAEPSAEPFTIEFDGNGQNAPPPALEAPSPTGAEVIVTAGKEPEPTLAEPQRFELKPVPNPAPLQSEASGDDFPTLTTPIDFPQQHADPATQPASESFPPIQSSLRDSASSSFSELPSGVETSPFEPIDLPLQNAETFPDPSERTSSLPAFDPTPEPVTETIHEVLAGESYWTISKQHYGAGRFFAALAEYNRHRIPRPERMKPGMVVLVPDAAVLHEKFPKLTGPADEGTSAGSAHAYRTGFFVDQSGQPMYRISKGDTLGEIAQKHLGRSSRWIQIYGMNREILRNANTLKLGTVLRLPRDASQVVLAPTERIVR